MAEDVDFKIQRKMKENISKSRLKNDLKEFRSQIRDSLSASGLTVANDLARNESEIHKLKYPNSFPINSALRQNIKIEFTFSNILLSTEEIKVKTLIEETLSEVNLFNPPNTRCISINETFIEKWVGLTRRIIAIERGQENDDLTLIRHIYDISAINQAYKINPSFIELVKMIVINDGQQFKNQQPEYVANPAAEIEKSLVLLKPIPYGKIATKNLLKLWYTIILILFLMSRLLMDWNRLALLSLKAYNLYR